MGPLALVRIIDPCNSYEEREVLMSSRRRLCLAITSQLSITISLMLCNLLVLQFWFLVLVTSSGTPSALLTDKEEFSNLSLPGCLSKRALVDVQSSFFRQLSASEAVSGERRRTVIAASWGHACE